MTTVLESLNQGLIDAMRENPDVFLIGEDILDPYGGAFKVTRGISTEFPDRVLTTPISEAGITGLAAGMAMRGMRPVVEIMFGDFLTLAADQIINHATKFRWMYNDKVKVPMVIRTPMGGRRGYGPTHSQTLEKHFLGVPGLQVVAPSTTGSPATLLKDTILHTEDPVLFVENKLQYLLKTGLGYDEFSVEEIGFSSNARTYLVSFLGAPDARFTIITYGYMVELCRQAMILLAYEHEIFAQMVVCEQLAPFYPTPLLDIPAKVRNRVVVEEGTVLSGWGAEVITQSMENFGKQIQTASRVAARNSPIPASTVLENSTLPGVESIIEHIRNLATSS